MARTNFDAWIPIEQGSTAFQAIQDNSAVEALGRHEPMASDTKEVPRTGTVDVPVVAKGAAYTESGGTEDVVTLRARKFASSVRIADEDLQDSPASIISVKQTEWANGYALWFDNACLGTTGAANGGTVPFDSVYRVLSQADAGQGYTANANIIKTAGDLNYGDMSSVFGLVEAGDYDGNLVVVAHPVFKGLLRGLVDGNGRPMFVEDPATGMGGSIFGYRVAFSKGAKTSAVNSRTPNGNPLMVVANSDALIVGDRLAPQTTVIPGWQNNLTDETLLKGRARKGFALAHPEAAAVIEITAS